MTRRFATTLAAALIISALASALEGRTIDLLINNAEMRSVIAGLTTADNGSYRNYDGAVVPW